MMRYVSGMLVATLLAALPIDLWAGQAKIGAPAPPFELKDVQGKTHRLADYKGRILVLHFQSCTCPWDRGYQPILSKIADRMDATKVAFLAINANYNESVAHIRQFLAQAKISYPVLKDADSKVAEMYNARVTPHIFVIDAKQVLRYAGGVEEAPSRTSDIGKSKTQYLVPVLEALLNGRKPPVTASRPVGCSIKKK